MMKRILKRVCLIPMALLILCSFGVCAAESGEPDYKVGLEIAFNHSEYVKGETATATIKLTGLTDEKAAGAALGAFETHIKFDNTKLEAEKFEFNDNLKLDSSDVSGFQVTDDNKDIIVAYFEKKSGVSLNSVIDDKLTIGTIQFKVLSGGTDNELKLNFEEDGYKTVVTKSFIDKKTVEEYAYSEFKGAEARIVNAILEPGTAKLENNTVKTEGLRVAASDNKGILIAQIYDKNTGLTKATKVIPDLSKASVSFDVSKIDKSNLKVRYYLWDSFLGMKALAESKAAEVK